MSRPIVKIRGHLEPKQVAKLVKDGRKPTISELLRLFKDNYGYASLDVSIEIEAESEIRECEVCGCTDDRACPGGCSWGPAVRPRRPGGLH